MRCQVLISILGFLALTGCGNPLGQGSTVDAEFDAGAPPSISAPSNMAANYVSGPAVQISWSRSVGQGTITYTVSRSTTSGSGFAALASCTNISTTSCLDSTAVVGTTYYYLAQASARAGTSSNSPEVTFTPTLPSGPVLSKGSITSGVSFSWTASTGSTAITYSVKRGTVASGPYAPIASGLSTTSYTDVTALTGITYYYVVDAVNPGGSASSNEISATPMATFNLTNATVNGAGAIRLVWPAVSGALSYTVRYGTSSGSHPTTVTTAGTSPQTISGLTAGTTYYFMVEAVNSTDTLSANMELSAVPMSANTILSSTITAGNSVRLAFSASSGATSYTVKYGTSAGVYPSTFSTSATSPIDITGLTGGTTYYFMVAAVNGNGSLNATSEVSATPLGAFTISSATPGSRSSAVAWTSASGATSYDILYSTSSGLISGTYGASTVGVASGSSVTGLTVGSTYYFRVRAHGSSGSILSSNELQATILPTISLVPSIATILKGDAYQFSTTGVGPFSYADAGSGFMNASTGFYDTAVNYGGSSEALTLTKTDSGETASGTINLRSFSTTGTYSPEASSSLIVNKMIRVGTTLYQVGSALNFWIVRKSNDDGATWSIVDRYRLSSSDETFSENQGSRATEARDIAVRDSDIYVVGSASGGSDHLTLHWIVRKSSDGGLNWTTVDDYSAAANRWSRANGVFVDGNNIYVVGMANNGANKRTAVVRKSVYDGVTSFGDNFSTAQTVSTFACQEYYSVNSNGADIVVGGFRSSISCPSMAEGYGDTLDSGIAMAYRYNGAAWSSVTIATGGGGIRSMTKLGATLYAVRGKYTAGPTPFSTIFVSTYNNGVLTDHSNFIMGSYYTYPYEINNDGTNLFILGSGSTQVNKDLGILLKYNFGSSAWQLLPGLPAFDSGSQHTEFRTGQFYGSKMILAGRSGPTQLVSNWLTERPDLTSGFHFLSSDSGASFSSVSYQNVIVPAVLSNTTLLSYQNALYEFTLTAGGYLLQRSLDAGVTWQVMSSLPSGFSNPKIDDSGNIFGAAITGRNTLLVWKSTDSGASFSTQTSVLPVPGNGCDQYSLYDYLAFGTTVLAGTGIGFHDCTDSVGSEERIFKSTDNGTTYSYSTGTRLGRLYRLAGNHFISFSLGGSLESIDGGVTWSASTIPSTSNLSDLKRNLNGDIYALYPDFGAQTWVVQKSTDSGATWSVSDTFQLTPGLQSIPRSLAFGSDQAVYIVGDETNSNDTIDRIVVRKLSPGGSTWRTVDSYQSIANETNRSTSMAITASGTLVYGTHTYFSDMLTKVTTRAVDLP